ncbi:HP0495 family protein [Helicobacter pylori]|uniref:HP0495 family protein n=1 Tax=Helicobacter pylori TaxID=210 RepID=UPI003D6970AC
MPSDSEKPTIIYPCVWDYRVIMTTNDTSALKELLETYQRPFKLEFKNTSKSAKFYSFNVSMEVSNESERNEIFQKISQLEVVVHAL